MSMTQQELARSGRGLPVLARVTGRLAAGQERSAARRGMGRRLVVGMGAALALAVAAPGAANAVGGWTLRPFPAAPATYMGLSGVACVSAASCIAVGPISDPAAQEPLAEFWDGGTHTWTAQGTGLSGQASAITCVAAASCTAVGEAGIGGDDTVPFAASWNGTSWTDQHAAPPKVIQGSENMATLDAISCASAADCLAVGYYATAAWDNGDVLLIVEHWNGSTWVKEKVPNPKGDWFAAFYGVSCVTAADCVAVGSQDHGSAPMKMLAEHWDGSTWTIQKPPSPGTALNQLNAVSCASATRCEAAGFSSDSDTRSETAVAERWNGSAWAVQAVPVPGSPAVSLLGGISCVSTSNCTATGASGTYGATSGLAEHWNGTAWSQQGTPATAGDDELAAVACRPGGFCLAVGDDRTAPDYPPIAESRNT